MIKLITYPAGFGQLSYSPFCVKAIWLLQASGLPWQRKDSSDPRKMPYAKLPAIRVGDRIIADSHNIQTYLETQGADFWGGVTDRGTGHALIRMAEEHMYFHLVMDRWANEAVWPVLRDQYFADIPKLIRKPVANTIRKSLLKGLHAQGIARFTEEERLARIVPDLTTISQRLSEQTYMMGDQISLPDYSVAAMIGGMVATPKPTLLTRKLGQYTDIIDYAARVAAQMAPETVT